MGFTLFCPDCGADFHFFVSDDRSMMYVVCDCTKQPLWEFVEDFEDQREDLEVREPE